MLKKLENGERIRTLQPVSASNLTHKSKKEKKISRLSLLPDPPNALVTPCLTKESGSGKPLGHHLEIRP